MNPTSVVPSVYPGVVPEGVTPVHRTGVVPWSLSYGGTSPDRPVTKDHTTEVPGVSPTPICGHREGPWICINPATHTANAHYFVKAAA